MDNLKEVKLKSGSVLKIMPAPFADAKALYQACLSELKTLKVDPNQEIDVNLFKDLFCAALASKEIEVHLWACMKRCLYNNERVNTGTFEPVEARGDYIEICVEVAKENVLPFGKSLYAEYFPQLEKILKSPA